MRQLENVWVLEKLATRIKQLRSQHNVTQEQFLFDTGIHIGRIEQAKSDIKLTSLVLICNYFNITLEDLFKDITH